MRINLVRGPAALRWLSKPWSPARALAILLFVGALLPVAEPDAEAVKCGAGKVACGSVCQPRLKYCAIGETYSAYDASQDPAADQSSTFEEPELLESLDKRKAAKTAPLPPLKPAPESVRMSATGSRIMQLPSGVKKAPKVSKQDTPRKTAPKILAESAPPALPPAPLPKSTPAPEPVAPAVLNDLSGLAGVVTSARYSSPASARLMPEKEYVAQSCDAWQGLTNYRLSDGIHADCVTMTHAMEFVYSDEWSAGLRSALHHGRVSGLKPMVVVIIETKEDLAALELLREARLKSGLPVEIKKVMLPEVARRLSR